MKIDLREVFIVINPEQLINAHKTGLALSWHHDVNMAYYSHKELSTLKY